MSKLSTKVLKEMMTKWLSHQKLIDNVKGHYLWELYDLRDKNDHEGLARKLDELIKDDWGSPKNVKTLSDLEAHVEQQFTNGNKWSRAEKQKLGETWGDYIFTNNVEFTDEGIRYLEKPEPGFFCDVEGEFNRDLVEKYLANPKEAEKCILRIFLPKNERIMDNYRLEVVTTHDDTQVVGWTVVVD